MLKLMTTYLGSQYIVNYLGSQYIVNLDDVYHIWEISDFLVTENSLCTL